MNPCESCGRRFPLSRKESRMDTFVHLDVRSAYSFLWGAFEPEDLVKAVAELGQKAVALTDSGLHGAVRFYKAAKTEGIQPIVGATVSIWDGSSIVLLARDFRGYGNLCKLLSVAFRESMAPKELIAKQDLSRWSQGLVCIAGGRDSRIRSSLEKGRMDAAGFSLLELRETLREPEHLFLALQNHANDEDGFRDEAAVLEAAVSLGEKLGIPVVATNATTFLTPDDYVLHRTLVGIQQRHHHRNVRPLPNDRFYLTSEEEMSGRIPHPRAIARTAEIAALCASFSLPVGELHPPTLQNPEQASKRMADLCLKSLTHRYRPVPAEYLQRIDRELQVINRMELADFFLLVRDMVDFARSRGIRHSIRGSAAGSLALYLLIGGVDPVANELLFERFINDGRGDLPDVDLDFDSDRRDEVIEHLMDLFPKQTTMVCTIQSFKVRSAVRLTARALGYSLEEIKRLASCLPWSLRGRNLLEALENLPELRNSPLKKEEQLVRPAARLTGLPSQCSVHLGGVLISSGDIRDWTPVGRSPKGMPVGQLDKDDAEAMGLLKLDVLGLRMHTAIRKSLELLREKGVFLDVENVPLDDRKTYALLRSTESLGVFQVESPGQRNLLGTLQPTRFSDLVAEISLFRPGPVEGNMVGTYVRRRNNEEPVRLLHPILEPILAETYGVILFQEQVLRIVHDFAGLSYADADAFRRAMTKDRQSKRFPLLKDRFVEGAREKGHSEELIEQVFEGVAAFASYGFCKAHAASFAHITYRSAFLKAHYPQVFYVGLLNAGHVGSYPPSAILNEARRRGIPVHPPHVNAGGIEYEPEGSGIRVPLTVINGIGAATARRIAAERTKRGAFRNRTDFLVRLALSDAVVDALTTAGALDGLEEREWELIQEVCNV